MGRRPRSGREGILRGRRVADAEFFLFLFGQLETLGNRGRRGKPGEILDGLRILRVFVFRFPDGLNVGGAVEENGRVLGVVGN
jgi:hypothetical protein